jgi:hypothetical protein
MVDLAKKISLYKTQATSSLSLVKIPAQSMDVAVVLDASKSMFADYKEGRVQALLEKVFGLASALSKGNCMDLFLFGNDSAQLPSVSLNNLEGYVEREILGVHKINQATNYAKGIECVNNAYYGRKNATLVLFITDGEATDKTHTEAWVRQVCRNPYFFQFVGIGNERFAFLEKLDDLTGRAVDNCGFIRAEKIFEMPEAQLYQGMLSELPSWLEEAKKRGWF